MNTRIAVLIAVMAASPSALAEPKYTYVEGAYLDHQSAVDDDAGIGFAGSILATPLLSLLGEHAGTGDFDHTSVGLLFHVPLLRGLHLNLGGTFDSVKVGSSDDNGQGVRGGLRWRPMIPGFGDRFELSPEVRRTYVFNDHDTSFRATALIRLARSLDFMTSAQTGDDDRFLFGIRYNFEPPQDFAALQRAEADKDAADRLALYDTAYRAALDAIRDADRLKALQKAEADKAAAERRAAARRAAAARRKPETAKKALECTPECCARLETLSKGPTSSSQINGLRKQ